MKVDGLDSVVDLDTEGLELFQKKMMNLSAVLGRVRAAQLTLECNGSLETIRRGKDIHL